VTTSPAKRPPRRQMSFSLQNERFRALLWQIVAVGLVLAGIAWLAINAQHNLSVRRIQVGFAFLGREASMPIADSWLPYSPRDTYLWAFTVGVVNTLRVAVVGIVLATILGTAVGIARLSSNWLLARLAAVYVEVLRDIPLLLQLLFWYVMMQALPPARGAWKPIDGVFLSNRGLVVPAPPLESGQFWVIAAAALGFIVYYLLRRRLIALQMLDGQPRRSWPYGLALVIVVPALISWVAGVSWSFSVPELRGFNFVGGWTFAPEYFALLLALVTYTSAFMAEIVRSGIQAVARGQWDAAVALGLSRGFVLRKIVLPQALRVIIPPMTSQYLNLTKNSSLAVAIGYQDIVSVANTTLNQTGQAIESIALIMAVFLTISLGISLFMNWYNARIALVER
jgi:general L-amino acid transport system permease protein